MVERVCFLYGLKGLAQWLQAKNRNVLYDISCRTKASTDRRVEVRL